MSWHASLPDAALKPLSATAFLVEVEGIQAGMALREKGAFRFVAVDARFGILDGSRFRQLRQLDAAVRKLLRMVRQPQPRQAR